MFTTFRVYVLDLYRVEKLQDPICKKEKYQSVYVGHPLKISSKNKLNNCFGKFC